MRILQNSWKSWKNRHLRTSESIKMDWCGFRAHHALRCKALDLSYSAKTYLMVLWCVERIISIILLKMLFSKISEIFNFCFKILQNGHFRASKSKSRHLRTFVIIKIDSRVVRPPCVFLRTPMDPKMSSKENFEFESHLQIFFAHFNSQHHVC